MNKPGLTVVASSNCPAQPYLPASHDAAAPLETGVTEASANTTKTPLAMDSQALTALTAMKVAPLGQGETGGIAPSSNPNALTDKFDFNWNKDAPPGPQTHALCAKLASLDRLFRTPDGQLLELRQGFPPRRINDVVDLEAVIRENINVAVFKGGKFVGTTIPSADLRVLMRSKKLQECLPVVDWVANTVTYNASWARTTPGYNKGPAGESFYYTGPEVTPQRPATRMMEFIAAMAFKTKADATNFVAFALTVMLRFMWSGGKPLGVFTANKSHVGKDTALEASTGNTKRTEVSYHEADWALQNECVSALTDKTIGVLSVGNIRSPGAVISSSFLERIITSPTALLQSSKRSGDGFTRHGDFIIAITANNARLSIDLANRSLPIHLEYVGDIGTRTSVLGDIQREYLPAHRDEIEAELCGMIEHWRDQGCPMDDSVRHPMRTWASTIGGILRANGFEDFLVNWSLQRNAADTLRESLGWLADAATARGLVRVETLVRITSDEGLIDTLIERRHRASQKSMERQLGVVLTAHQDEIVSVDDDDGIRRYRIVKARRADPQSKKVATYYQFERVEDSHQGATGAR